MKKSITNNFGFTLIELLVAVSTLGILSVVITSVLVQSFKGEKKVQVLNQTKQNAQVILEKIIKDVQGASSIYCVGDTYPALNVDSDSGNTDTLVVVNLDSNGNKTYNRYRFIAPINSANSTNGKIVFDNPTLPDDPNQQDLCDSIHSPSGNAPSLTDTDPNTGISLSYDQSNPSYPGSHVFTDNRVDGFSDSVTINFKANSGVSAQGLFDASELNGVSFTSTAIVRNGSN